MNDAVPIFFYRKVQRKDMVFHRTYTKRYTGEVPAGTRKDKWVSLVRGSGDFSETPQPWSTITQNIEILNANLKYCFLVGNIIAFSVNLSLSEM